MAENAEIRRKIFGKSSFTNVVQTEFKQLVPKNDLTNVYLNTDVPKFFQDYEGLFYDIPASGSTNSHLELVKKSSDYIGLNIQEMQDEIATLREENISLKNQLFIISQTI